MRKTLIFIMIFTILSGIAPVDVFAKEDSISEWAKPYVNRALEIGIVPEDIQGNYQQVITREEFASLFVYTAFTHQAVKRPETDNAGFGTHAITKEEFLANVKVTDYSFTDTTSENIKLAYMMGLVDGTSKTTFTPDKPVTRQEAAVMLVNYAQFSISNPEYNYNDKLILDLNKTSSWAKDSLIAAFAQEFFNGTSGNKHEYPYTVTMDPLGNFTREQAITVALRAYDMGIFAVIKLRGQVAYIEHMLRVEWEISSDKVTAVKFKDGQTLALSDGIKEAWVFYKTSKVFTNATDEQILAGAQDAVSLAYGVPSKEMVQAAGKGENAIFDLGYAEYEMLNDDFIFQYRFKNNGVHNYSYYGGSKYLTVLKTRIK